MANQQSGPRASRDGSDGTRGRRQDKQTLRDDNLKNLRGMFKVMEGQLAAALPKFITVERMIRVASTTVQRVPKLLECAPVTIVGAVMQSAQLGLEPDNVAGTAYLVPFWNSKNSRMECNLIPGYRGLMMLARRSREIAAFDARVVKVGDFFDFEYGDHQFLRHKPALALANQNGIWQMPKENGAKQADPATVAAYMIAFYPNARGADGRAMAQFHVMLRPELLEAKEFTKSRDRDGNITGPWVEHPDEMFKKTVIRRGAKLLPFSIELNTAIALEDRALAGKSQNLGVLGADVLGVDFDAEDDDDAPVGEGLDPELVKRLDLAFTKAGILGEADRTIELQRFKDRIPALLDHLEKLAAQRNAGGKAGDTGLPEAGGTGGAPLINQERRESEPVERTRQTSSGGAPSRRLKI